MSTTLEVFFSPAESAALKDRSLEATTCVVFDILRATTTMLTALSNGAKEIIPVEEIGEALVLREGRPDYLLAGERNGVLIRSDLTGSIDFDLGNSPREFTPERVKGRTIVITTTTGTRAMRACAHADEVFVGAFLNLGAVAGWIERQKPRHLLLVCAGTHDQASYEDVLAAGAVLDSVWDRYSAGEVADSAAIARQIYQGAGNDLMGAMRKARNGRRLLSLPDLSADVAFCCQRDTLGFVGRMDLDGVLRRVG